LEFRRVLFRSDAKGRAAVGGGVVKVLSTKPTCPLKLRRIFESFSDKRSILRSVHPIYQRKCVRLQQLTSCVPIIDGPQLRRELAKESSRQGRSGHRQSSGDSTKCRCCCGFNRLLRSGEHSLRW